MKTTIQQFLRDEDGVAAIEYALLAGLIACVIITAVTTLGNDLTTVFNTIGTKLSAAVPAAS